ncbi:MAG: hypothetical protein ABJL67_13535 [Sulfitobacter sp.]
MMHQRQIKPDANGRLRKEISIQRLLEWAFADEFAQVDFEDAGTLAPGYGGVGNAGRMADYGALGCRIMGGGRSWPDHDADLVASAVAVLPEGCGGRAMAVAIAEWARARTVPDAMIGARMRCVPVSFQRNQHGVRPATEFLGCEIDRSGRKAKRVDVRVTPVHFTPTAQQLGDARRTYLQWRLALLELRNTFQMHNNLTRWVVTNKMPPTAPWKKTLAE